MSGPRGWAVTPSPAGVWPLVVRPRDWCWGQYRLFSFMMQTTGQSAPSAILQICDTQSLTRHSPEQPALGDPALSRAFGLDGSPEVPSACDWVCFLEQVICKKRDAKLFGKGWNLQHNTHYILFAGDGNACRCCIWGHLWIFSIVSNLSTLAIWIYWLGP